MHSLIQIDLARTLAEGSLISSPNGRPAVRRTALSCCGCACGVGAASGFAFHSKARTPTEGVSRRRPTSKGPLRAGLSIFDVSISGAI